jgi:WD40 repeat protein
VERKECINTINNDFTGGGEDAITIISFSPRDSARILIGNGVRAGDPLPTTISNRFTVLDDPRLATTLRDAHGSHHCCWYAAAYSHCGSFVGALLFGVRNSRQMRLAMLESENMTVLREAETHFERETYMPRPRHRIVFSPDDSLLVVTGGNRGIVFFADNLKIKEEQLPDAMDVAFHPTQDLIASCTGDGIARLGNISPRYKKSMNDD